MASSRDTVTLPIWSEAKTAEPHDLNRHTRDGFLTIVTYPLNLLTPTNVLDIKAIPTNTLGHQSNPRTVDESKTDTRDQRGDSKHNPVAVFSPKKEGVSKIDAREHGHQEDPAQSQVRFWSEKVPTSIVAANPSPSSTRIV